MPHAISTCFNRLLNIPVPLQSVVWWYLLALCVDGPKKTQSFAVELGGKDKSQFSRLLKEHRELAIDNLTELGRQIAKKLKRTSLITGAPWTVFLIIDATLHTRSSRHVQNSQVFNHGEGWVIGHQWTNVILVFGEKVIPLAQKLPMDLVYYWVMPATL